MVGEVRFSEHGQPVRALLSREHRLVNITRLNLSPASWPTEKRCHLAWFLAVDGSDGALRA